MMRQSAGTFQGWVEPGMPVCWRGSLRSLGNCAQPGLPSRSSRCNSYSRFLAKARPDGDFKYFSKAKALSSSENAIYVFNRHGLYFEV
jgi:hypothetical protein